MEHFDLIVIGSGPAGQRAALTAAKAGLRVMVVDRRSHKLGGVSLHTGTIPSKTLREAVLYIKNIRRRNLYGPSRYERNDISLEDLLHRVRTILEYELQVIETQFSRHHVATRYGTASFTGPHEIEITPWDSDPPELATADHFVIATGTVPREPEDIPFDYRTILNSNFIFSHKSRLEQMPRSLIVYGAGVIGSEYALMFGALGCRVWLVDNQADLFPFVDFEIRSLLKRYMADCAIEVICNAPYKEIISESGQARLTLEDGRILTADALLFSKGRMPCIAPLHLDRIGIEPAQGGFISVNETHQTSISHIYAAGDVIGFPALASTSAEQGRLAASHILGHKISRSRPELFPIAIYTIPEFSSIGKTEQDLQKNGTPYLSGAAPYRDVAKAAISGDDRGLLKILFEPDSLKILGVHAIGDQAAEIIHIGQMLMATGNGLEFLIDNVFNYPTWAEAYKLAAQNGLDKLRIQAGKPV